MKVTFDDLSLSIFGQTKEHLLADYLEKRFTSSLYDILRIGTIFEHIDPFAVPSYRNNSNTLDLGLVNIEYKYALPVPIFDFMTDAKVSVADKDALEDLSEIERIDVNVSVDETDWEGLRDYVEGKYGQEIVNARNQVNQDDYIDDDGDLDEDSYYSAMSEAEDEVLLKYRDEYERQEYDNLLKSGELVEALEFLDDESKEKILQYITFKALFGGTFELDEFGEINQKEDALVCLGISEYDVVSNILPVPEAHVDEMKKYILKLRLPKGHYRFTRGDSLLDSVYLNVHNKDEDIAQRFGRYTERHILETRLYNKSKILESIGKMLSFKPRLSHSRVFRPDYTSIAEDWVLNKYRATIQAESDTSFTAALTKEVVHTKAAMSCIIDKKRVFTSTEHKSNWVSQLTTAIKSSVKRPSFPKELVLTLEFKETAFMTTGGTTLQSVYNGAPFDRPLISILGLTIKPVIFHKINVICEEAPEGVISFGKDEEPIYAIPDGCTIDLRVESDLLAATNFDVQKAFRNLHIDKFFTSNLEGTKVKVSAINTAVYCNKVELSSSTCHLDFEASYTTKLPKPLNKLLTKKVDYAEKASLSGISLVKDRSVVAYGSLAPDGASYALDVENIVNKEAVSAFYESRGALREYVIIKEASWKDLQPISPLYWDNSGRLLKYNWPERICQDAKFLAFLYGEDAERQDANIAYDLSDRAKPAFVKEVTLKSHIGDLEFARGADELNAWITEGKEGSGPRVPPLANDALNLLGYSKTAIGRLNEGNFKKLKMATNTNFLAAYYSYGNFINITNRGAEYLRSIDMRWTETAVFSLQSAFNAMGVRGFAEVFSTAKGILPYMYGGNVYMHSGRNLEIIKDTFVQQEGSKGMARSVCFKLMYSIMETLTRPIVLLENHISTLAQRGPIPNPLSLDEMNEQFSSKGYYNAKTIEEDFVDSLKSIFDSVEYDGDKQLALFSKVVKYGSDRVLVTKLHAYKAIDLDLSTVESTQRVLDAFTLRFNALALKEIFPVSVVEDQTLMNDKDTVEDMLLRAYPDLTDQQKEYLEHHLSNYYVRHREDMLEEVILELNALVSRGVSGNFVRSYPQRGIVDDNVFFEGGESDILVYSNSRETLESMTAYERNLEAIRYGAIRLIYNSIMLKLTEIFSLFDGKEQTEKRDIFAAALKGESGHINMVNVLDLLKNPVAGTKAYKFFESKKIKAGKSVVGGDTITYPMYNALLEDKNPIDYWSINQIISCPRNKTITARYPDSNKTEERLSLLRYAAVVDVVYNSMKEFTGEGKDAFGPTIAQYKDLKMTYITANEETQIQNLITLGTAYSVCFGSAGMGYRTPVRDGKAEFLSILRKNRPRTFLYLEKAVISESKGVDNSVPFAKHKKSAYEAKPIFLNDIGGFPNILWDDILPRIQRDYNLEELAFLAVSLTEVGVASGALPVSSGVRKYHYDNLINVYALACLDYYNFKKAGATDTSGLTYLNALLSHLQINLSTSDTTVNQAYSKLLYAALDKLVDEMPFEDVLANIEVEDTIKVSDDWKKL